MLMLSRICFFMIGTNRLGKVTVGGSQKSYAYNADGTMKTDGLRGLALTYNYLKLPRTVKKGTTSTVTYIYDANGNKLAVSQDGTAKNYYCGDFVYDGSLAVAYILTPNGQLTRNPTTGAYTSQYNIPDHLGNVRSVVSSSGTVLQSTDYYPFGLAFADADIASNRYLYNGKELEDYTLGTSYLGTLDYGARHYDPRIARWTVPDPMAEKYYGVNAYGYCAGDPVNRIDLYGSEWKTKEDKSIANNLSETITERQRALTLEKSRKEKRLNKLINTGSEDKKVRRLEETIQSIDMQMATLEDLSKGLSEIEASSSSCTFNTIDNGEYIYK